jgi:SAM-dependent methyltransferase
MAQHTFANRQRKSSASPFSGARHAITGFFAGVVFVMSVRMLPLPSGRVSAARNSSDLAGCNHSTSSAYSLAQKSYTAHASHISDGPRQVYESETTMRSYLDADALDQRRHGYMLSACQPLLAESPGSYWMTVGDLRFGSDALYLKRHGARVMATDLHDQRLALAHARGYLAADEYSAQNVENLAFADETFDYVICKEAFHHFPRPMFGFYEMLRVAKRGVVLIEPQDVQNIPADATSVLTSYHADGYNNRFEVVGNYVYMLSVREILKAAWALKLSTVAVRGLNDHFVGGMTWTAFRERVEYLDSLGYSGRRMFNLVAVIVFKQNPSPGLVSELRARNFSVLTCPNNCNRP